MRIGILLPNWIGDAVMATPALTAIRQQYADAVICGVMRPVIADTLAGSNFFDETVFYDRRSSESQYQMWPVVGRIRKFTPDLFVLLTNSTRAGLMGWLSSAAQVVGVGRGMRRWLLTTPVELPPAMRAGPHSAVDVYLEVSKAAACRPVAKKLRLSTRPRDEIAADDAFRELGIKRGQPLLTLNTGGAYGPAKDWPAEHFAELAREIATNLDAAVLILCGPAERENAERVERAANHPLVHSLAQRPLSVGLTKACLRRSRLLVSTDSGPRHIAAAFGVPVVALFGPTDPRWSENYHPREAKLRLRLDCQPCAKRVCPLKHHRCMRELSVKMVMSAVQQLWNAPEQTEAA